VIRPLRTGFAWLLGSLALLGLVLRAGLALAVDLPADRQALILVKVLAYDGNLKTRAGNDVVVGVLFKGGNAVSERAADDLVKAFATLGAPKVQGLPIKATKVAYGSAAGMVGSIKSEGLDTIYICPGLDAELAAILELTRVHKVMSIAGIEDYFTKGAALGVFVVQDKPAIFVNLPTSKNEGVAFGSDLLRLAKVVK
jgi:hypothetical protein